MAVGGEMSGRKAEQILSQRLRGRVLRELRKNELGPRGRIRSNGNLTKDDIRALHADQRKKLLERQRPFIDEWEDELIGRFANGGEVDPGGIRPKVIQVRTERHAALFRYVSLHWSVPVSKGYGRRTRFLVVDTQNDKLIGIFALGDPVYNLTARDELIGWNVSQRNSRLYNVLDAFVLGAVPPYQQLIGGKLVAMAAVSDSTREMIQRKYHGRKTEISGVVKQSRPVLVTTTSALGRSSVYNRLKFHNRLLYHPVGYTRGFGHFHFSDALFKSLVDFLDEDGDAPGYDFGQGPNWRIRTLRTALERLDLDSDLIRHGVKREVFIAPLARKWKEYLRGETDRPAWLKLDLNAMAEFFVSRWAIPRSQRDPAFREIYRDGLRLRGQEGD